MLTPWQQLHMASIFSTPAKEARMAVARKNPTAIPCGIKAGPPYPQSKPGSTISHPLWRRKWSRRRRTTTTAAKLVTMLNAWSLNFPFGMSESTLSAWSLSIHVPRGGCGGGSIPQSFGFAVLVYIFAKMYLNTSFMTSLGCSIGIHLPEIVYEY